MPVAELVPELAAHLGLLSPANALAGYRVVTLTGGELEAGSSLVAQGVRDGAVLVLATAGDRAATRYDDMVEAMADAVARDIEPRSDEPSWFPAVTATLFVALGLVVLGVQLVETVSTEARLVLATSLAAVVLALGALPWVSVAAASGRSRAAHVAAEPAGVDARLAHQVLVAASGAVGLLLVLVAPAAVSLGRAGTGLAVVACLVVLVRTRWHVAATDVLVGQASGVLGLVSVALSVVWLHPTWRPAAAAALAVTGAAILAVSSLPALPVLRRRRLADLVESACLVAVLPLVVLASGAFSAVRDR